MFDRLRSLQKGHHDRPIYLRVLIGILGSVLLVLGVIMVVLPGPAFLFIPAGLGLLSLEFTWAQNLLIRVENYIARTKAKITGHSPVDRS